MKINQIIVESTTSGSVATVAQPIGSVKSRNGKAGSMFKGKTTNKPFYEDQVNEEDRIIAPGKGNKVKPGLLSKPEVSMNPTDSVKLDVPLLIRLLEYAREDANSDMDLHDLAEKLVARGTRGKTLTMKDYEYVVDECMSGVGVGEGKTDFAAKLNKNINKANKAVVQTKKAVGARIADIGAGGKEHNVKTDKAWDDSHKVKEGVVDTIKKGVKNVKRGLQGWGDGVTPAGIKDRASKYTNDEVSGLAKGYDELRKTRATLPTSTDVPKHSPAGLQKRVLDREMKRRGLAQEGTEGKNNRTWAMITDYEKRAKATKDDIKKQHYMQMAKQLREKLPTTDEGEKVDRMVKHVAQSEKKLGHSKKEAENIAWATANKRGMLDNKNKKK